MQQLHGAQDTFSAELVDVIQQALAAEGVQGDTRQIAQRIAANTLHHFLVERGQTTSTMVKGVRKNLPLQDQQDSVREALPREEYAPVERNRQEKGVPLHLVQRNLPLYPARLDSQREESSRAALIATLIRKHFPQGKRPLERPGGYFTRRCQEYEETGIPVEFAELVTQCAQMSYSELEEVVKRTYQHLASMAQRSFSRPTESSLFKPKRGHFMDQATAEALARRIPLEDPYVQVRGVNRAQEGIYVVEVFIDPVEYRFGSIEDWEAYHAQMQELEQEGETR
jgi:hypothetical protein